MLGKVGNWSRNGIGKYSLLESEGCFYQELGQDAYKKTSQRLRTIIVSSPQQHKIRPENLVGGSQFFRDEDFNSYPGVRLEHQRNGVDCGVGSARCLIDSRAQPVRGYRQIHYTSY